MNILKICMWSIFCELYPKHIKSYIFSNFHLYGIWEIKRNCFKLSKIHFISYGIVKCLNYPSCLYTPQPPISFTRPIHFFFSPWVLFPFSILSPKIFISLLLKYLDSWFSFRLKSWLMMGLVLFWVWCIHVYIYIRCMYIYIDGFDFFLTCK